jgi:hypothetical protein
MMRRFRASARTASRLAFRATPGGSSGGGDAAQQASRLLEGAIARWEAMDLQQRASAVALGAVGLVALPKVRARAWRRAVRLTAAVLGGSPFCGLPRGSLKPAACLASSERELAQHVRPSSELELAPELPAPVPWPPPAHPPPPVPRARC